MAVSTRTYHRQRNYSRLFIALAILAAVVAIAPIAAALLGYGATAVTPRTAFATAPAGEYAVLGRSEGDADVISVAWANNPGAVTEIARVPHLPGFTSTGAVSPDGKFIALVSVDGGSPSHPLASLNVVGLETGLLTVAARNVVPGQTPVWSNDSSWVAVSRLANGNEARGPVQLVQASASGKSAEVLLATFNEALGAFPVGYAGERLVTVVISARGSVLFVGDSEWGVLSPGITRDWKVSPDGSELAFIETATEGGVRYLARTISLTNSDPGVAAQSLAAEVSALGTAWNPSTKSATFGVEPGNPSSSTSAQVQALSASTSASESGFDVPLAYSANGQHLAVTRWSGVSFQEPGNPVLQLVSESGRTNYESFTRFYGWSVR